jgi:hypothetical protein
MIYCKKPESSRVVVAIKVILRSEEESFSPNFKKRMTMAKRVQKIRKPFLIMKEFH